MAKMQVDTKLIRELADMLNDTDLSEIEVEDAFCATSHASEIMALHFEHLLSPILGRGLLRECWQ